jgi:GT2 family glycosyltransferase
MDVSIIVPAYNPNKDILDMLTKSVKSQKFSGKVEFIIVDEKKGFSTQINIGIRKAKYGIVVELPQDCVPKNENWLENLVSPFKDKKVVASVSRIEYPNEYWDNFSYLTKGIMIKEKGVITSSLDGKGGAYRKSTIESIGMFDEKNFLSAGEDYDTYIKIKDKGIIAYPPGAQIVHYHPTNFLQRLRKHYQYANGYGALVKIHGKNMTKWWAGILKAIPLFGLITYPISYPWKKGGISIFPAYIAASIMDHFYYVPGFWKGYINGKQTVR